MSGNIQPVDPTAPNIKFQLGLPTNWNTKALMLGGGFDGSIPAVTGNVPSGAIDELGPLGRGYAVFASDSGHQSTNGIVDGSFSVNQEAYDNFAGAALKKTHDAAVFLIKARYAVTGPSKSYFAGGSTGGREALTVAQRWPADWDGVIAFYPAYDFTSLSLQQLRATQGFAAPGGYLNTAKRTLLFKTVMGACDALDGATDGIISNVQACNSTFDPSTAMLRGDALRCPGGTDTGDTCLSDVQIEALNTMNTPLDFIYPLTSGETSYPGYNVFGADLGGVNTSPLESIVTRLALGTTQPSYPLQATAMFDGQISDQFVRYSVVNNSNFNSLTFDPANAGQWGTRISELSALDANSSDLSAFNAKGGKLLMAHGTVDLTVSTRATEIYYQRLIATMTAATVNGFVRFYEIPGLQHGTSTVFNPAWDSLTALENWNEKGVSPVNQVMTDTIGVPGRTRPLCNYPTFARFKGTGDVNSASSFTCVAS
ncbi:tannase/feruloyl esterase family alpha/beta hydrolase [uncultured Caballeronia sp.]|uniref:tannase/feruloyl esterase family alpha/beta hydrolase n=1 Tax=uncultured Caballeronia sp. TaxID=1827198 RepID=UPI0035CA9B1B